MHGDTGSTEASFDRSTMQQSHTARTTTAVPRLAVGVPHPVVVVANASGAVLAGLSIEGRMHGRGLRL